MNYIKEAENRLTYYRDLQRSIDEMTRRIARLVAKAGPEQLKAAALDDVGLRSGRHDTTMNVILEIQKLQESLQETQKGFIEIDAILDEISQGAGCENYGNLLRMWYIQRVSKEVIAEHLSCSIRKVYYDKDAAIRKFAVRIFGMAALKIV